MDFDVPLTIHKNRQFQQHLERYAVMIAVLNAASGKLAEVVSFLPAFNKQVGSIERRKACLLER